MKPVIIKRYRNRRLYDTARSQYITLDDLARDLSTGHITAGQPLRVLDADTGADLTRRTLVQVLLTDAHAHKLDLLPEDFLRTLIHLEDTSLLKLFAHYLETSLSSFAIAHKAVSQNLELMRRMAPALPTDLMQSLRGFFSGVREAARPGSAQPKPEPKPEPEPEPGSGPGPEDHDHAPPPRRRGRPPKAAYAAPSPAPAPTDRPRPTTPRPPRDAEDLP